MEVWVNNCRFFELAPGGGKEVEGPGFELPGVESLHLQVQAACHHASVGPTAPRDGRGGGLGGGLPMEIRHRGVLRGL